MTELSESARRELLKAQILAIHQMTEKEMRIALLAIANGDSLQEAIKLVLLTYR